MNGAIHIFKCQIKDFGLSEQWESITDLLALRRHLFFMGICQALYKKLWFHIAEM